MLGSFDDAEDLVQETFLRTWRGRAGFEGRSLFRTWLYRIPTNACLNALGRTPRRFMPPDLAPPISDPDARPTWDREIPWLQRYPDRLLEPVAPSEAEPDAVVVSRETIELAYIAALQHLPPKQRAILILRDVLGWPAKDTGALLDMSLASVNSAHRRARSTMRTQLPTGRLDWAATGNPTEEERSALKRFMDAFERGDAASLTALLREDAQQTMPLAAYWLDGREMIVALHTRVFSSAGDFADGRRPQRRPTLLPRETARTWPRAPGDSPGTWLRAGLRWIRVAGHDRPRRVLARSSSSACAAPGSPSRAAISSSCMGCLCAHCGTVSRRQSCSPQSRAGRGCHDRRGWPRRAHLITVSRSDDGNGYVYASRREDRSLGNEAGLERAIMGRLR